METLQEVLNIAAATLEALGQNPHFGVGRANAIARQSAVVIKTIEVSQKIGRAPSDIPVKG